MVLLGFFIVYLTFTAVFGCGWAPLDYAGVGSPHLRLSQTGHTVEGVVPTGTPVPGEGKGEVAKGGQDLQDSAKAYCVADTWGLLAERTFQNSQIRPPKMCYGIYMHMNKLGPKVMIFKLVE